MESQPKKAPKVILSIVLLLLLPVALALGIFYAIPVYYYDVTDQLKLMNYQPPAEIKGLADKALLTDKARKIFYVHQPELDGKTTFNQNCPIPELTFVLGCYTGSNIYLLDIDRSELEAAEPVTAAHETLHAAYTRLSDTERRRVNGLLQDFFEESTDQRLTDLIDKYKDHDPSSVPTELHSIIGTEVAELSPELEEYYAQYFTDRSKVVAAFESYEQVFSSLEQRIEKLQSDLENSKTNIDKLEKTIDNQLGEIDAINAKLKNLESDSNIEAYNALIPEQNQLVSSYNANIREHKSLIKSYNSKVAQVNKISLRHNELLNSVNSKYQELDE